MKESNRFNRAYTRMNFVVKAPLDDKKIFSFSQSQAEKGVPHSHLIVPATQEDFYGVTNEAGMKRRLTQMILGFDPTKMGVCANSFKVNGSYRGYTLYDVDIDLRPLQNGGFPEKNVTRSYCGMPLILKASLPEESTIGFAGSQAKQGRESSRFCLICRPQDWYGMANEDTARQRFVQMCLENVTDEHRIYAKEFSISGVYDGQLLIDVDIDLSRFATEG